MFRAGAFSLAPMRATVATARTAVVHAFALAGAAHAPPARPPTLAPTWFRRATPAQSSAQLKFLLVSMRHVEIKASDLTARAVCDASGAALAADADDEGSVAHFPVTTFGDPSGGESLTATQPILRTSQKSQWGKAHFGKVWHTPRNFPFMSGRYWQVKFTMKKHRYTKRWRKRRYKVAALANMPFAKKLRVDMIPKLQQSKKRSDSPLDLDFTPDQQEAAIGALNPKTKSGNKPRSRPKSKYQM
jgi:hypothetical protein